jgi:hypothetical protein
VRSGKEAQRGTQDRRYEGKATSKKDNEDGKGAVIILERSEFKKKEEEEFCDYMGQFKIVGLVETWVEERSWKKIEKLLLKEYKWQCQGAKRGRKSGGEELWNFWN